MPLCDSGIFYNTAERKMELNIESVLEQLKWLPSLHISPIDIVQAVILSFAIYYVMRSLYKTRAWILAKGLFVIGVVYVVISLADMTVLQTIMQSLFSVLMIAIVLMLQPELQRIVEVIGRKKISGIKS